jgi:hypothetical protein
MGRYDSQHWSYRLAEFAERRLGWLATLIVIGGIGYFVSR